MKKMILAVQTNGLPKNLNETGFYAYDAETALNIMYDAGLWIGPRETLEVSPEYRQIIPYIILKVGNNFVRYTRTKSGEESRLHDKMSIGLGGHIDLPDIIGDMNTCCVDLTTTVEKTIARELLEEIGDIRHLVSSGKSLGILIDNTNDVGKVHIGLVGLFELKSLPSTLAKDNGITAIEACTVNELEQDRDKLEGWSQIMLDYFQNISRIARI